MQELFFAVRRLRRQPGLSVAVLTLGLGLGASIAVFTLVNAVLLRPLPYPNPDRLMTIGHALRAARVEPLAAIRRDEPRRSSHRRFSIEALKL